MKTAAKKTAVPFVAHKLRSHFGKQRLEQLVTASRNFPLSARVDVQLALDKIFAERFKAELIGVHRRFGHETMTIPELLTTDNYAALVAPLQHLEIDIVTVSGSLRLATFASLFY